MNKFILLSTLLVLLGLNSIAQTNSLKYKTPDYGKAFIAANISCTVGVVILGLTETEIIRKDPVNLKGIGTGTLVLGGLLTLASVGEYIHYKAQQRKLNVGVTSTGLGFSYKF